ncbi:DUF2256 domain-containing protein [Chitinasiproducens palmae]|uniref:DUF2256 domain-containing protein n=1 Tax=Chitinasiproducens palmae TaxID=1770053 RepID=UPI000B2BB7E6|nr:DUF2256 domain-containing protein [Chitinasiproducens palmae]
MKMRRKGDLPTRVCAHCGLPFTWRKKWRANWDEVRYCSERCRGEAQRARRTGDAPGPSA